MGSFQDTQTDLIETLQEWAATLAEDFSKACCTGDGRLAARIATEEGLDIDISELIEYLKREQQSGDDGCSAEQLEEDISWRPGDHYILDLVRQDQPYHALISLVLLERCNYRQAEKLVALWHERMHPGEQAIVAIDSTQAMRLISLEGTIQVVVRYKDIIWKTSLGVDGAFDNEGRCLLISQLDQIWHIKPAH